MEGLPGHRAARRGRVRGATAGPGGGAALSPGRRVVCWRHGQTTWNRDGRFQGQTDVPLDEVGQAQARRAARLLAALRPSAIVSSDLRRAADTAAALAAVTGLDVAYDKDLRERAMRRWEGLTRDQIEGGWPGAWAARTWDGGEGDNVVAQRVHDALLRALLDLDPGGTLVVVSHGAALRLGMATLLGLPGELWGRVGPLANCCWSVLAEGRDGWRLLEHNAGTLPEPVMSDDR